MKPYQNCQNNGGLRFRSLAARLALCLILVCVAAGGLTTAAQACGLTTHHNLAERALALIDRQTYPGLATLLEGDPGKVKGVVTYGALFPDWIGFAGPGDGEEAHRSAFKEAYLNHVAPTFKNPSADETKSIAFLFGIIAHNEADNAFHFGPGAFWAAAQQQYPGHDQSLFEEDIDLYVRDAYEGYFTNNACDIWDLGANVRPDTLAVYNSLGFYNITITDLEYGFNRQGDLCKWEAIEPRLDIHTWMEQNILNYPNGGMEDMARHIAAAWQQAWDELIAKGIFTYRSYLPVMVTDH